MTWQDAQAALLLLAEERIGKRLREIEALEQAQFERSKAALRGTR